MSRCSTKLSLKGTEFHGPKSPHGHWYVDISYVNICVTFYYLCSLLNDYSRFVVHWEIREQMREKHVSVIIQWAKEKLPDVYPRIILDQGPQFVAKDFKSYIQTCGMNHVLTSPHYPQSNGKKERWFRTLKAECIRRKTPLSLEEVRKIVTEFVEYYNTRIQPSNILLLWINSIVEKKGSLPAVFESWKRFEPGEKPIGKICNAYLMSKPKNSISR